MVTGGGCGRSMPRRPRRVCASSVSNASIMRPASRPRNFCGHCLRHQVVVLRRHTALTLDDDVAVQLERMRRARNVNLKELVNEALRRGLRERSAPARKRKAFRTPVFHMGKPLISIDNVAEALAYLEGEGFK
jgi:molybdenum cofactor biosynthesis enzyme MoaA